MAKITKFANLFLLVAVFALLLHGIAPTAYAASTGDRQVASDEAIEVDFLEESQGLKLIKGKSYLLSYPADGEGWQVSEVRYSVQKNVWLLFDEEVENEYLVVERCEESEPGKVQIVVKCKSSKVMGLQVSLENEITGEKQNYAFVVTVTLPQSEPEYQFVIMQPTIPDEGGNDEEQPTPAPIVIDTTGWSFDAVTAVYDGTEYTVEVMGLPDYVTPVYTNNTRTNAGVSTAHVSFVVPEGYATPEDMETTITIEQAPIYVITDKNLVTTEDGKLKFLIPEGSLPEGVNYTYTVNDVEADSDYAITNTGMYIVNADFELTDDFTEEMRQNYIVESSSAIYNVLEHEDITPSEYGLNFVLELKQEESQNPDEVRVTVSIKFASPMGRNSVLTYEPVYDSDVLTYTSSVLPDGMGGGKINAYGVVPAYTNSFGLLNDGPLTTFVFNVNEGADATNIPFTVTEVSGVWIAPDPSVIDKSTSYSTAIILNPDVDAAQYTVMLPYPEGWQSEIEQQSDVEGQALEEEEAPLSDEAEVIVEDEAAAVEEVVAEPETEMEAIPEE